MQKWLRFAAVALLVFNGIGALYGAGKLITDPSGASMGIDVSYLQHSPFPDFLLPGIVLLVCNGLLPFWVAWKGLANSRDFPLWLLTQAILSGGWIVVQVIMLRQVNTLHLSFISIAAVWLVISLVLMKYRNKDSK